MVAGLRAVFLSVICRNSKYRAVSITTLETKENRNTYWWCFVASTAYPYTFRASCETELWSIFIDNIGMFWIDILYCRLLSHVECCRGVPRDIVATLHMLGTWAVNRKGFLRDNS